MISNSKLEIRWIGSNAYRTIQFSNEQHALWQVAHRIELLPGGMEVAEFGGGVIDFPLSALLTQYSELGRGCGSVGRAVALQAIGQEFESPQLHQPLIAISNLQLNRACSSVG